jgi:hypothetical protein
MSDQEGPPDTEQVPENGDERAEDQEQERQMVEVEETKTVRVED